MKQSKLSARNEVNYLLTFIRDYGNATRTAAIALIRELRLAIRQANHGAGHELEDGSDDYNATLAEGDVLLAVANTIERDFGIKPSSYDSLRRIDWEIMDRVAKPKKGA